MQWTHSIASCAIANFVASFPGLPRFFCSSVSVDNNTRMRKGFRVLLSTETEEQKNGVGLGTRLLILHVCPNIRLDLNDDTEEGRVGACAVNIFQLRLVRRMKEL